MTMKIAKLLIGVVMIAIGSSIQAEGPSANFATVTPEALDWVPIPDGLGATSALVHGDKSKAGTYVIRVRFPAGVMDLPHSHSEDRHVTVLQGVWYAGTGPNFDSASATPLAAGSYMFHPAGGVHWDGAAGDEGAVVQIIGTGPVETKQEHSEKASWVDVKQRGAPGPP